MSVSRSTGTPTPDSRHLSPLSSREPTCSPQPSTTVFLLLHRPSATPRSSRTPAKQPPASPSAHKEQDYGRRPAFGLNTCFVSVRAGCRDFRARGWGPLSLLSL